MKKIIIITVALFIMSAFYAHAAEVKNVKPHQEGKRILFEYDLVSDSGEDEAEVTITLTIEGKTYTSDNLHFEGDYGEKVKTGRNRKIYWNVLQDFPKGFSQTFQWEIVAGGKEYKDPITGMEFVFVKGGCYQMGDTFGDGDSDEKPVHEVCVDNFWMGKYEVTNAQFRKFRSVHNSEDYEGFSLNGDNQPAVYVSWEDATEFAMWLSQRTGKTYRLPTEAEWEYVARAGTKTRNYWGNSQDDACRYANVADRTAKRQWSSWTVHDCDDGYKVTAPVGSFQPNNFGLYDMMGNVLEWIQDRYNEEAYSKHSRNNPIYDVSGARRVIRGGSWNRVPRHVRCASRRSSTPVYRDCYIGFRLLREK